MHFARLRRLRGTFHALLVLGYLALGLASAWHAPHFSQARAAIDVDGHVEHEAVFDGACALCTVKASSELGPARFVHRSTGGAACVCPARHARLIAADGAWSARPRAPPALLS
ncbi:MAG: hypothetical protein K0Q91_921 [Fibrobacteria bacterium]|jgi:hypothetical protein|nr:hypothetical protein [Fibrobacteria bacterium]